MIMSTTMTTARIMAQKRRRFTLSSTFSSNPHPQHRCQIIRGSGTRPFALLLLMHTLWLLVLQLVTTTEARQPTAAFVTSPRTSIHWGLSNPHLPENARHRTTTRLTARSSLDDQDWDAPPPGYPPVPPALSLPVWSLATPASQYSGDVTAMNIVTYASPVTTTCNAQTRQRWMISLQETSRTREFFDLNQQGVLQLLTPAQANMVPVLGQQSGYTSRKFDNSWVDATSQFWSIPSSPYPTLYLLPGCASYLKVQCVENVVPWNAGDHTVYLVEVTAVGVWNARQERVDVVYDSFDNNEPTVTFPPLDSSAVLYTGSLRAQGILPPSSSSSSSSAAVAKKPLPPSVPPPPPS